MTALGVGRERRPGRGWEGIGGARSLDAAAAAVVPWGWEEAGEEGGGGGHKARALW